MKAHAAHALEPVVNDVVSVHEINPLLDRRWVELTERSDRSSLFHSTDWLEALRRTYGYEPVAFTDSAPGEALRNALLFCRINSWLTGPRLVALPFSDHCEPLMDSPHVLDALLESLKNGIGPACKYIELRPLETVVNVEGYEASSEFYVHVIDLRPDLDTIRSRFHKNHVNRAIRKASRSGLTVEVGRGGNLLIDFYHLHAMTRRRHGAPVQPFQWFQNLVDCLSDRLTIYMARYEGRPVATILTARHKKTLVFKYGCLNPAYNRLGGTPHLFWNAIQEAKQQGLAMFDLGRTDVDNPGLLAFKDHLGANRSVLTYYRYPRRVPQQLWLPRLASSVYARTPAVLRAALSSRLYKHFG